MKTVTIGQGQITSHLGFGGAALTGGPSRDGSLRLLAEAFEAGVRHFDVAPSYGLGLAEDVLGEFIQTNRGAVSVTTKVGLPRPAAPEVLANLHAAARPLFSFAGGLRRRLGGAVNAMSVGRARFELKFVRTSLTESMRRLRTDHVEVLLLHELTVADASEELQRFLEGTVSQGMVGSFGIGSHRSQAELIAQAHPDLTRVVQTAWGVGDEPLALGSGRLLITHGSLRRHGELLTWLRADHDRLAQISAAVGEDLGSPDTLADLLLAAALSRNPTGIVLVTSSHPERIARHAATPDNLKQLENGRRFSDILLARRFVRSGLN